MTSRKSLHKVSVLALSTLGDFATYHVSTNVCFSVTGAIPTQKHNLRHSNGNVLVFVTRKENTCHRPKLKLAFKTINYLIPLKMKDSPNCVQFYFRVLTSINRPKDHLTWQNFDPEWPFKTRWATFNNNTRILHNLTPHDLQPMAVAVFKTQK